MVEPILNPRMSQNVLKSGKMAFEKKDKYNSAPPIRMLISLYFFIANLVVRIIVMPEMMA